MDPEAARKALRHHAARLARRTADQLGEPAAATDGDRATEADIRSAYRLLLGREPDPEGAAHFRGPLVAGTLTPAAIAEEILSSVEFAKRWPQLASEAAASEQTVNADGFAIVVNPLDWAVGATIVSGGGYEPEVTGAIRSRLPRGGVLVDAGANIGWHSLVGASAVGPEGRVIAVEPNPRNTALLGSSCQVNGFEHLEVVTAALGDTESWLALETDASNGRAIVLGPATGAAGPVPCDYVVPSVRLDDLLGERLLVDRVDVIKVDVEGAEGRVLRGADQMLARSRPVVIFEWYPMALTNEGNGPAEPLELLEAHGYRVGVIGHPSASGTGPGLGLEEIEAIRIGADRPLLDLVAVPRS